MTVKDDDRGSEERPGPQDETLPSSFNETEPPSSTLGGETSVSEDTDARDHEVISNRYEVMSLLGRGSMGNVYKVRDRALDEIVALKSVKPRLLRHDRALDQFRREVKLARRVTHPNVARTFDIGMEDDIPYLTMEYIEGRSLEGVLDERAPLGDEDFITFVEPICAALQAAHDAGVVHRDLKPENVMVTESGRVIVTDFGVARTANQTTKEIITQEGLVGTPAYMAPEQVDDEHEIDARADIYALGCMMYEMLTGKLPWTGHDALAIAFARCINEPPTLPEDGDWPQSYRKTVLRCLQREPHQRFRAASEVIEALRSGSKTYRTYTPGRPGRAQQPEPEGDDLPLTGTLGLETMAYEKSVAVLPVQFSGPEQQAYLADGFTEELIDELSRCDGLVVVPRGAILRYRDTELDPQTIGEELGAQVVVESSLHYHGDRARIRVAVISTQEGFQIDASSFEASTADLIDLSRAAAESVERALTISSDSDQRDAPSDPVVVDLYMRARHHMHEEWYRDLAPAIDLLRDALERTPNEPRILAGLATAQARAAFLDDPRRAEHVENACHTAEHAIRLAPEWPEPYVALASARYHGVDFRGALEALAAALERVPDFFEAHELRGRILAEIGPLDTAIRHLERAVSLHPHLYRARWDLARAYALQGEWQHTDALLDKPVDPGTPTRLRFANRSRLDMWRDTPKWTNEPVVDSLREGSDIEVLTWIMRSAARGQGIDKEVIRRLDSGLDEAGGDSRYRTLQYQFYTEIAARVGMRREAIRYLGHAVDCGLVDINWLRRCPLMTELEHESEYHNAVATVESRVEEMLE